MAQPNSATDLVRSLIGSAFADLVNDTRRAQSLLREAMPGIVNNFQGLQDQVAGHVKMVDDLSNQLQGAGGDGGLVGSMRVVIDTFVKDLVGVSHQSMRIVERVSLMEKEVNSVMRNARDIEEMAHTTHFIALNATIEAQRSEAGRPFRVVAEEIKRLAGDAEAFSSNIRDAIGRCKRRLTETHDLVTSFASHDMTVALSAQTGVVATVTSIGNANQRMAATLHELDTKVRDSIRALQFDDILMQLLGSIGQRIGLLESVWLESLPATLSPEDAERLRTAYERHRPDLEGRQVVGQESLDAGTAELF